jgi:hypothetical protein
MQISGCRLCARSDEGTALGKQEALGTALGCLLLTLWIGICAISSVITYTDEKTLLHGNRCDFIPL